MAGSRARWIVLGRQGVSWQAEVAVPEKKQRRDPVSPKIQQDNEETPNSWILQQMIEFPGPDSFVNFFKKDKKNDSGNYRRVSLTSAPGKIMENITLLGIIEKHLKDRKAQHSTQHSSLTSAERREKITSLGLFVALFLMEFQIQLDFYMGRA
ncbi:hypothetical protein DUI87_03972 [Hirundo rustica rustica]|uniref:Uncharacterized protein n=1 Tax=Hirundo rustica rustica TaxID=333673 RepID=A0A3M0L1D8_HIRRU|nr:hypothetical protein DUI87_03972 [Hirundo rustica rustica]